MKMTKKDLQEILDRMCDKGVLIKFKDQDGITKYKINKERKKK